MPALRYMLRSACLELHTSALFACSHVPTNCSHDLSLLCSSITLYSLPGACLSGVTLPWAMVPGCIATQHAAAAVQPQRPGRCHLAPPLRSVTLHVLLSVHPVAQLALAASRCALVSVPPLRLPGTVACGPHSTIGECIAFV